MIFPRFISINLFPRDREDNVQSKWIGPSRDILFSFDFYPIMTCNIKKRSIRIIEIRREQSDSSFRSSLKDLMTFNYNHYQRISSRPILVVTSTPIKIVNILFTKVSISVRLLGHFNFSNGESRRREE